MRYTKTGALALLAVIAFTGSAVAQVANVESKWSSGDLVFYNKADGTAIMTIKDGTDGVQVHGTLTAGTQTFTTSTITTAAISGGSINGTTVGATTPSTGKFTTLQSTGATTIGDASGDALTFHPGAWTLSNGVTITGTWTNLGTVTTADVNGGTIDGTAIGGSTPAAGAFTTLSASTSLNYRVNIITYATSGTQTILTAAQSGSIIYVEDIPGIGADDTCTALLPTAAAGLVFTFIDDDATANNDLRIQAAAGDTINNGTAAKIYECTGDATKQSVTLIAVDADEWIITNEVGTWSNNNG